VEEISITEDRQSLNRHHRKFHGSMSIPAKVRNESVPVGRASGKHRMFLMAIGQFSDTNDDNEILT
jgi:hypothetical protein